MQNACLLPCPPSILPGHPSALAPLTAGAAGHAQDGGARWTLMITAQQGTGSKRK